MSVVAQHVEISKAQSRREFREDAEAASARRTKAGHHGRRTSCDRFLPRSKLRSAWIEFLGRLSWDVFATLTYRPPPQCRDREDRPRFVPWNGPSGEVLIRNVRRWLWLWQLKTAIDRGQAWLADDGGHDPFAVMTKDRTSHPRHARGSWPNAHRHGRCYPQWIAGIEPHKSGVLHAHVMIHWSDRLQDLTRTDGWCLWFQQYGRAEIEAPRDDEHVAAYCSKLYTVKGADLHMSTSFDAYRPLRREPFVAADVVRRLLRDDRSLSESMVGVAIACPPQARGAV